ncbi:MAG: putative alpha/beta hydrolase family esterase [Flavobacteriaceae bacterium]|jgi:predicted alpha/beta hydrolase family esterase
MKKQIIIIHGGDCFSSYEDYIEFLKDWTIDSLDCFADSGWKKNIAQTLSDKFEVYNPQMPCKINAKYYEWSIWFEKIIPLLRDDVILVGHSLGATFLAKYLAEHTISKIVHSVFLVAGQYDTEGTEYSMADFGMPSDLSLVEKQAKNIHIMHSSDDEVVSFHNLEKFKKALPSACIHTFSNKGHFNQDDFPEIVELITKQG